MTNFGFIDKDKCEILKGVNGNVTDVNLNKLCSNNNADLLHTHPFSNINDVTTTATEIDILSGAIITTTELNYLSGTTSPIQDQVDNLVDGTEPFTNITITGGTISGLTTPLAVVDGGTGGNTASSARTSLGLEIGVDVQAWDEQLDQISLIIPNNGVFIVGNGTDFTSETGDNVLGKIGTTATITQLNTVTDGSNADTMHVHTTAAITDFSAGIDSHVTYETLDTNGDVGQVANTVAAGNDDRFPTSDEKAAMTAANNPSALNPFATVADLGFNPVWREPIIDFYDPTTGLPTTPSTGDRYISSATANNWTIHYIYEYNGTTWDEHIPVEGWSVWNQTEDLYYNYNDTNAWVTFGSLTSHNGLNTLQGGTTNEYYHLTLSQHDTLTNGSDATTLHIHDSRYYTETEIDTTINNILNGTTSFTKLVVDNLTIDNNKITNTTNNNSIDINDVGTVTITSTNSNSIFLTSCSGEVVLGGSNPIIRPFGFNDHLTIKTSGNGDLILTAGGTGTTIITNENTPFSSVYELSLQSNDNQTWFEILNNGGVNKGVFFGIYINHFELWNYQGGNIRFYTDTVATSGINQMELDTTGNLDLYNGNFDIQSGNLELNSTTVIRNDGTYILKNTTSTNNNSLYYDNVKNDVAYKDSNGNTYYLDHVHRTTVNDTNYTVVDSDRLIAIIGLTSDRTITLPDSLKDGRIITFKDESGSANGGSRNIILTPQSGLIDGQANFIINSPYSGITIYSNGIDWFTI